MEEVMQLEGPVLKIGGKLVLILPLWAEDLMECSRGVSEVPAEFLKIVIPEWLAGMLRIEEGDFVCVEDADGKFHSTPSNPRAVH